MQSASLLIAHRGRHAGSSGQCASPTAWRRLSQSQSNGLPLVHSATLRARLATCGFHAPPQISPGIRAHLYQDTQIPNAPWDEDGFHAEVGMIGWEGMVGLPLIVDEPSFTEALIQGTGHALRMEAAAFRRAFDGEPTFRSLILRYNEAMQSQVMQTAACNGRHRLEQRLARWLLMTLDRSDTDHLEMTHEFLQS